MRPTFMGINTTSRAMMNYQKSIDIVGNNLANIDTTGYTRQRTDIISMGVSYAKTRYSCKNSLAGNGANIAGISQVRDVYLDKRFREEYADVGYYDQTHEILTDVQNAIDEIDPATLSTALKNFQASFSALAKDGASDIIGASGVRATADTLSQVLRQMYSQLDTVWENTKYDLNTNVTNVNKIIQEVADLNVAIAKECRTASYNLSEYYMPNELLDQRNLLLDQLAEYGDINVKQMSDGTVQVTMAGKKIVDNDQYESLMVSDNGSDHTVSVQWLSTGEDIKFTTGALKGYTDMLNGRGPDAKFDQGETMDRGILYYQDKIDSFAVTMADAFNHLIPIVVENESGEKVYKEPMEYKQLFTFDSADGSPRMSAEDIRISQEWEDNADYIVTDIFIAGSDLTDFTTKAIDLFGRSLDFGEFSGSMTDYIIFYSVTNLGAQIDSTETKLETSTKISDGLLDQIFSVSGVSFDEEAANSIKYQKAYDASSRMVTIMDDMLDKLINGTGRVGL